MKWHTKKYKYELSYIVANIYDKISTDGIPSVTFELIPRDKWGQKTYDINGPYDILYFEDWRLPHRGHKFFVRWWPEKARLAYVATKEDCVKYWAGQEKHLVREALLGSLIARKIYGLLMK